MQYADLTEIYLGYIACLNRRDWYALGDFVDPAVVHNGRRLGIEGYRAMLESDYTRIPDLRFVVEQLVSDAEIVAARLKFDCTPKGEFLGLNVDGRRVRFAEHAIYAFSNGTITEVWSVIDKQTVEEQLAARGCATT